MEEMQEERRIEEMQKQIKMKELELEQFMLSKEKGGESSFGVTFKYKINLILWSTSDFFHLIWRKMWTNSLFILRKLLKVWLRPMNTGPYFYRVPWQGKPEKQVQIMKKWKKPFWKHVNWLRRFVGKSVEVVENGMIKSCWICLWKRTFVWKGAHFYRSNYTFWLIKASNSYWRI